MRDRRDGWVKNLIRQLYTYARVREVPILERIHPIGGSVEKFGGPVEKFGASKFFCRGSKFSYSGYFLCYGAEYLGKGGVYMHHIGKFMDGGTLAHQNTHLLYDIGGVRAVRMTAEDETVVW